jgi:hypothetical protein
MRDFFRQVLRCHGSLQQQMFAESNLDINEFVTKFPAAPRTERPEWLRRMIDQERSTGPVAGRGLVAQGMAGGMRRQPSRIAGG